MSSWTRLSTSTGTYSLAQVASLAFNGNVSAGSLFVVDLFWEGSSTVPTISDSLGNGNYSQIGSTQHVSGFGYAAMFWMTNTKGAGSNTINITNYGGGTNYVMVLITEYSTPGGAISLDGNSGNAGSGWSYGATVTSNSFSTSHNGDLIHAMASILPGTSVYAALTNGSGFTSGQSLENSISVELADEYQIQGSSGSIAGTFTIGASSGSNFGGEIIAAAFYAAGGGGANWLQEGYWWNGGPYAKHRDMKQRGWKKQNGIYVPEMNPAA